MSKTFSNRGLGKKSKKHKALTPYKRCKIKMSKYDE